jgi:CheY-like chemotaxis protein
VRVQTLIVEQNRDLAAIWARFLEGQGLVCQLAAGESEALEALRDQSFDALVLDVELIDGAAFRIADFATYRNPEIAIIAVTAQNFFSDGQVFELIPNARGLLPATADPGDMAALVQHYGGRAAALARG